MTIPTNGPEAKKETSIFTAFVKEDHKFTSADDGHQRVNNILLGRLERPALDWLARHMPAWVTPDELTGLGFFAAFLIFLGYVLTNVDKNFIWLSSFGFVLNWFGDSLDGTLARLRHIERPRYGFFIDHTIDAFAEVLVFLGLAFSPYVDFRYATITLIGYLLLSVMAYITTYVKGVFRISYIRLGPTEMRAIAIIANTIVYIFGAPKFHLPFGDFTFYDLVSIALSFLLYGAFFVMMITQARELNRLESIKPFKAQKPRKKRH